MGSDLYRPTQALFRNRLLKILQDARCGLHAEIATDEHLLQLIKEVRIDGLPVVEQPIDFVEQSLAGFRQALFQET
jgi:hypothetical protein